MRLRTPVNFQLLLKLSGLLLLLLAVGNRLPAQPLPQGPFAPAARLPGSDAVHMDDPRIIAWATDYRDYQIGEDVDEQWQTPHKALGPANGNAFDVVTLGKGGSIVLVLDRALHTGKGPSFAVFGNAIGDGRGNDFLELAFVEVSSNGQDFVRFPSHSLQPHPIGPFATLDSSRVDGFAGKYIMGFGTPFDLSQLPPSDKLDRGQIRFIRIVDIIGDGRESDSHGNPIYDPYPTTGSAGFDLDAIGVLRPLSYPNHTQLSQVPQEDGSIRIEASMQPPPDPALVFQLQYSTDLSQWTTLSVDWDWTHDGVFGSTLLKPIPDNRFFRIYLKPDRHFEKPQ